VRVGELLGSFGGQLLTDRWEVRYITRVCPFGPRIAGTYSTYQANIGKSLFVSPNSCSVFVSETRGMRVPISMPILCVMTPTVSRCPVVQRASGATRRARWAKMCPCVGSWGQRDLVKASRKGHR
jgi:hypothetical protein